jgi:Protein of unknown function (DUF742)
MSTPDARWLDGEAGPVVRPYALTRGRTQPAGETPLGLVDVLVSTGAQDPDAFRPSPEQRQILRLCRQPVTLADLASDLDLPIGVVRVLASDLAQHGMVEVARAAPAEPAANARLLREVLNGLRAL